MQRISLVLLAVALWACTAAAQRDPQSLPDDREQYMLIVVVDAHDTESVGRVNALIKSNPKLKAFADQCARHAWRSTQAIYRERYASALPPNELPIIALARPGGGVVYKASGRNVPWTAEGLLADFSYYLNVDRQLRSGGQEWDGSRSQDCPDGNCPLVNPTPSRDPSRPWLRPDGPLRPDNWIPDSIDLNPQVSVDLGANFGLYLVLGIVSLAVLCLGGFIVYIAFQD